MKLQTRASSLKGRARQAENDPIKPNVDRCLLNYQYLSILGRPHLSPRALSQALRVMAIASTPQQTNKGTSVHNPPPFARRIRAKDTQTLHILAALIHRNLGISSHRPTPVLYPLETVKTGGLITVSIPTLRQEISMEDLIISMPHHRDIRGATAATFSIHDKAMYGLKI